jgi:hypothetical protein
MALRVALLAGVVVPTAVIVERGPQGSYRGNLPLLVLACAAFAVLTFVEVRHPRLPRVLLVPVTAVLLVLAVSRPPAQSNDVWLYASYGRMVSEHGANPYRTPPSRFPTDPLNARVADVWQDTRSPYGPSFIAVAAAGTAVTRDSAIATRLFFQGLAAAAVFAALMLIERRTRDPLAWLIVGVNPAVVIGVVNGGHNDALIGLALLGGVLLAGDRRPALAGLALGAAALVKLIIVLPLAAALLWIWRNQGMRSLLVAGYVSVGLLLGGYALAGGWSALEPLQESRSGVSRSSVWSVARHSVSADLVEEGLRRGEADPVARERVVGWANLCVAVLTLLIVFRRLRARSPAIVVGGAIVAYLLVGAYVVVWYTAWSLMVLALRTRSVVDHRAGRCAVAAARGGLPARSRGARRPRPRDHALAGVAHRHLRGLGAARARLPDRSRRRAVPVTSRRRP